ncbi:fibronectin-binding protein A-like [Clarias gariepinus]|uniref:fibronectin-binding protein A-like n=1 Tax=Clarias gariepinus TaxID=13013 RepID=UPI00234D4CA4|nr:fibronectin-binding protein A-like [Clarias gariepinus]
MLLIPLVSSHHQLEVTENMGDLGVVSYLTDEHGNVVIGPTACLSKPPTPNTFKSTTLPTTPLSPTLSTPSEEKPKKRATDEKKREKKKVTKRRDSVILKLPIGEAESHEPPLPTTPVTPGTEAMPLPDPRPEASTDGCDIVGELE